MNPRTKRNVIATLLRSNRPDLANIVAGTAVVTASTPLADLTYHAVTKALHHQTGKILPPSKIPLYVKEIKKYLDDYRDDLAYNVASTFFKGLEHDVFEKAWAKAPTTPFKMSKTFEIVTEESAKDGDAEERGFEYEDKTFDNLVEIASEITDGGGGFEASSSSPHKGIWWTSEPTQDMHSGAYESYGFHPEVSEAEAEWLFHVIKKGLVR